MNSVELEMCDFTKILVQTLHQVHSSYKCAFTGFKSTFTICLLVVYLYFINDDLGLG